ncbi:MAG: leucine-rich repeat domain-containing protein [Clostridiales bacterium]|nr:leucine-rich repeat domain-containing protein [Clostridiales bacterium]
MMYNYVEGLSPIAGCTNLRFLNVSNNNLTGMDTLLNLKRLERLWMNCSGLSNEQIAAVIAAQPGSMIKASQTNPEYAMSLWYKGNEGYVTVQELYGLRAKFQ